MKWSFFELTVLRSGNSLNSLALIQAEKITESVPISLHERTQVQIYRLALLFYLPISRRYVLRKYMLACVTILFEPSSKCKTSCVTSFTSNVLDAKFALQLSILKDHRLFNLTCCEVVPTKSLSGMVVRFQSSTVRWRRDAQAFAKHARIL